MMRRGDARIGFDQFAGLAFNYGFRWFTLAVEVFIVLSGYSLIGRC